MEDQNKCGAKTRSGNPCQRAPAKGRNRCKLHGGESLQGTESPSYVHGMYSAYAGESLKEVLAELEEVPPEELTKVDNELKLLQALIMKSKAIEEGTGDLHDLDTISKVIERLIKSKQRAVALRIEEDRLIPATDIKLFINFVEQKLVSRFGESDAYPIINEFQNFKLSNHEN